MFNIINTTIKRMVLEHLVEQVDSGGLDSLLANGFSPELIDDLRKRPTRDFFHAAQVEGLAIKVSIDTQKLMSCLWMRDRARRDEMLKEYFVRHGASIILLRTLFTLSKQELQRLRVELDLTEKATNGRPRLPPTAIRDHIHCEWHAICHSFKDEPERERLWRLHQKFPTYSMASIHRCTDEFKELGSGTRELIQASVVLDSATT
jgi:Protein of unknown function (DUF2857)